MKLLDPEDYWGIAGWRLEITDLLGPPEILGIHSHASIPTPVLIEDGRNLILRLFISCRNEMGLSSVYSMDIAVRNERFIPVHFSAGPVLGMGAAGSFDSRGVLCTDVIATSASNVAMLYAGFSSSDDVPYTLLTGVAMSASIGGNFQPVGASPLLAPVNGMRHIRGGAFALRNSMGPVLSVLFVGGQTWTQLNSGRLKPDYDLYCARVDSRGWFEMEPPRLLAKAAQVHDVHAFGRPWVQPGPVKGQSTIFVSERSLSTGEYRLASYEIQDGVPLRMKHIPLQVTFSDTVPEMVKSPLMYLATLNTSQGIVAVLNGPDFGREGVLVGWLRAVISESSESKASGQPSP